MGAVHPLGEQLLAFHATVAAAHQKFLAQQARAVNRLVELRSLVGEAVLPDPAASAALPAVAVQPAQAAPPDAAPAPAAAGVAPVTRVAAPLPAPMPPHKGPVVVPPQMPGPVRRVRRALADYPGPKLDRRQLEHVAEGKISEVLGPVFARQDQFVRQVRMPMPPLLLADRVLGIDAEAGAVGQKGVIWTETDVLPDAWYLHAGRMPAGVLIEAGQADLLLVSYLGADFVNKGERVYRLLGCEATFHAPLPTVGDTLHYEIHLDGYAQQGPVRLFFFHYDCFSGDERIFSVRHGQAGFFSDEELANSNGVIWDPYTADHVLDARVDPPAVVCERSSFTAAQVTAFSEGRVVECFGHAFAAAQVHVRTPAIARGRMLLFDDVVEFAPRGGPWGRGYLRAEDHIHPDEWFFAGHFKNDPCMPGTMMLEGCLQTMAFYMAGLGYTLNRDGWRFEPAQEEMYKLICRGQVTPAANTVVYEVFVEEVVDGPIPTLYADLLCTVDGLAAFHCRRMGLRLVPAFPLESRSALLAEPDPRQDSSRSAQTLGHTYDAHSIAACAWGAPSTAFGDRFARFDGPQRCPRLPGPPYLFVTRVTQVNEPAGVPVGSPVAGGSIVTEYRVPADAWYFGENGCRTMPYAVLVEAALQPCGWLACYKGSALASAEELYFRNLDGTATQYGEVLPEAGVLRTHVTNTSLARLGAMSIVGCDVTCFVGDERVFSMTTTFGFFPKAALASQAGLPAGDEQRLRLQEPSDFRRELGPRPPRYFAGSLALPGPMLLLLDRISGFWPAGGEAGLGRVRSEIDVDAQDWFFQCHFMGDSVQPGSLGLEAMLQTLQFYMIETGMGAGITGARFEPIQLDAAMTWKYRGQVMPTAQRVTVELEITDKGSVDNQVAYAVATASLWADGLRIYEATNVCMRIVADPAGEHAAGDERLDPAVDTWLTDHCPTWTVPALAMMSMADRLAAGAKLRAPGRKVIGLRNVRVQRWLNFGAAQARTLRVVGTPHGSDTVAMQLLAWDSERSAYNTVAGGDVIVGEHWLLPPGAWPPVAAEQPEPNPYAGGVLFHGPAYQLLAELRMDGSGASYWLDLDASGVPAGALNQGLLDAATHGIPHDALWRWSDDIGRDAAAYPIALTASFYGPTPMSGRIRCEARFGGFRGDDRQFPVIHVQIIRDGTVWAELELVEMLLPKGPLGQADPMERRAFLAERRYVPGLSLSQWDGETTSLAVAQVKASDWLPGTVAATYGVEAAGHEQLAMRVAIREHAARRFAVHPSQVIEHWEADAAGGTKDGERVRAAATARPLNPCLLQVERHGSTWLVRDASDRLQEGLDVSGVQAFWRERAGAQDTLVEDLTLALMRRFVRAIEIADPSGYAALQGRGVLYLANHQLDIESVLFVSAIASLQGTVTTAVARQELGESWVGPFFDICFRHPQIHDLDMLLLIDRDSPEAVLQVLAAAVERAATQANSLLVHVEGKHARQAGQPVEVVSTSLIDLAVAKGVPIVPLRFAGGLPVEPATEPLAFPLGYAKQDFWIGAPMLPQELVALSSAARKAAVLAALNGFGGRWHSEAPNAGDATFAAAVAAWRQARGVSDVQASLWCALEEVAHPSLETRVLRGLIKGEPAAVGELDLSRRRWLAQAGVELFGIQPQQLLDIS
jgi:3-hydroxymyristoyl/3-hydroxydecanoyl-(acyl carrier protein) dehydratase